MTPNPLKTPLDNLASQNPALRSISTLFDPLFEVKTPASLFTLPPQEIEQFLTDLGTALQQVTDTAEKLNKAVEASSPCLTANNIVNGDRRAAFGHPLDEMTRTGQMWGAILGVPSITGEQVALCMIAVKLSRQVNRSGFDNLTDIAGYAECIAKIEQERIARKEREVKEAIAEEDARKELAGLRSNYAEQKRLASERAATIDRLRNELERVRQDRNEVVPDGWLCTNPFIVEKPRVPFAAIRTW